MPVKKKTAVKKSPAKIDSRFLFGGIAIELTFPEPICSAVRRPGRYGVSVAREGVQTLVYFSRAAIEPNGWITLINVERPDGKPQNISIPLAGLTYVLEDRSESVEPEPE